MKKFIHWGAAALAVLTIFSCEKNIIPDGTGQMPDKGGWELKPGIEEGAQLQGCWRIDEIVYADLKLNGGEWEKGQELREDYENGNEPRLTFLTCGHCLLESFGNGGKKEYLPVDYALGDDRFTSRTRPYTEGKLVTLNDKQLLIYTEELRDQEDTTCKMSKQIVCSRLPEETANRKDFTGEWLLLTQKEIRCEKKSDGKFVTSVKEVELPENEQMKFKTLPNGHYFKFKETDHGYAKQYGYMYYETLFQNGVGSYSNKEQDATSDKVTYTHVETVHPDVMMEVVTINGSDESCFCIYSIYKREELGPLGQDLLTNLPVFAGREQLQVLKSYRTEDDGSRTILSDEITSTAHQQYVLAMDPEKSWFIRYKLSKDDASRMIQEDYYEVTGTLPKLNLKSKMTGTQTTLYLKNLEKYVTHGNQICTFTIVEEFEKDGGSWFYETSYLSRQDNAENALLMQDVDLIYKNITAPDYWRVKQSDGTLDEEKYVFVFDKASKTSGVLKLILPESIYQVRFLLDKHILILSDIDYTQRHEIRGFHGNSMRLCTKGTNNYFGMVGFYEN